MNYIFFIFLLVISMFFTIMIKATQNPLVKVIAGSTWLITGILLITQGIDIATGTMTMVYV